MDYEGYGEKNKDDLKNAAFDCAKDELKRRSEPVAKSAAKELVKFSDVTIERGYKVSCDIAEVSLPPKYSKEVERQLRISVEQIKKKNADNLDAAAVEIISSSTKTIFDVASGEKNFDEAREEIFSKTKVTVKKVVIEEGKEIAAKEAQRIGTELAGKTAKKFLLGVGTGANSAVEILVLGNKMKDSVLKLLDGEIDVEQYIFEMNRACLALAIKAVEKNGMIIAQGMIPIPVVGAMVGSTVTAIVCNSLVAVMDASYDKIKELWDASKTQSAADRRKVISKIKTEALVEMERQRDVMKKYFADEKFQWDKNVQEGFELITSGTYSNDVEIIAQGLDKILKNFGSRVAFSNREEFRRDFRRKKIFVNL